MGHGCNWVRIGLCGTKCSLNASLKRQLQKSEKGACLTWAMGANRQLHRLKIEPPASCDGGRIGLRGTELIYASLKRQPCLT